MFIYFLVDFGTFSQSVPDIKRKAQKLDEYLTLNILYMAAGLLLGILLVNLADAGMIPFLANIGFPLRKSPESALTLGLLNQWMIIKYRKWKNSLIVETNYDNSLKTNNN